MPPVLNISGSSVPPAKARGQRYQLTDSFKKHGTTEIQDDMTHVQGGHFMNEDPALFDAPFFGLTADTARAMDPQLRLSLESTFEAFESAGIPLNKVAGSETAVFAGTLHKDYHDGLLRDPETMPPAVMGGIGSAMLSNRISHFFDLRAASATVDTGCSSGLTALHMACQALRSGECSAAVVTASNLLLNPDMFVAWSGLGILSGEGRSYPFDHRASGFGRGEGVVTLVIKPLQKARTQNDPVRAVIRATALNQDGKTATITSPSQSAQEKVIHACYGSAGLDPADTMYVECHGTGTPTGDPVEAAAISAVFARDRSSAVCIGSVKSNIGHTEPVSGLAGLVKVVFALERGLVPPSVNFEKPNPAVDMDKLNLRVPTALEEWPGHFARRASVNSFGYGGSNAHVIVECPEDGDNPVQQPNGDDLNEEAFTSRLFILSAKDEEAAKATAGRLAQYLQHKKSEAGPRFLHDLAYTLAQRRTLFPWTMAAVARNADELLSKLEGGTLQPVFRRAGTPRISFAFTGQGAQWFAMGRGLIGAYPLFAQCLQDADR